jgi:hypothetical protein
MQRRLAVAVTALVAIAGVLLSATATQASQLYGKYLQHCALANTKQVDPLVSPGNPMSDHPHSQHGGLAWDESSRTADLLDGGTSCVIKQNKSVYWVSDMVASDGTLVHAYRFKAYYAAGGKDTRAIAGGVIHPFPNGWRVLALNPKSPVIQQTGFQQWRCYPNGTANAGTATVNRVPPESCAGPISSEIVFPSCWDGWQLDSADHKSHAAYPTTVTLPSGERVKGCPASHPVAVPEIQSEFFYARPSVGWVGSFLASDHGIGPRTRTVHGDVIEAWEPIAQAELTKCLNDPGRNKPVDSLPARPPDTVALCGLFTFESKPGAPNHWIESLNAHLALGARWIASSGYWTYP